MKPQEPQWPTPAEKLAYIEGELAAGAVAIVVQPLNSGGSITYTVYLLRPRPMSSDLTMVGSLTGGNTVVPGFVDDWTLVGSAGPLGVPDLVPIDLAGVARALDGALGLTRTDWLARVQQLCRLGELDDGNPGGSPTPDQWRRFGFHRYPPHFRAQAGVNPRVFAASHWERG